MHEGNKVGIMITLKKPTPESPGEPRAPLQRRFQLWRDVVSLRRLTRKRLLIFARMALGEFRKRFSCVRVSLRSGSSRYVKPDPVGEVMSCACKTLRVYSVSHSIRCKSPIYAWLHLR